MNSLLVIFADDTKIYQVVNSSTAIENLRSDLHNLVAWSNEWQCFLTSNNVQLCTWVITILRLIMLWMGVYCNVLVRKKTWGLLWVMTSDGKKQCCEAVKKGNTILGTIKRNFTDRSQSALIPLYKSLVRSHLEYCCSVWNPHFRKDIELIEGVQRWATKLVKDVEHLHYNDRLEHLGLMCLHTRRIKIQEWFNWYI